MMLKSKLNTFIISFFLVYVGLIATFAHLIAAIAHGEEVKWNMAFLLSALFIYSAVAFLFLSMSLRKIITVPFQEILTATDRITSGDLDYRIGSKRKDEFGIISKRFDSMVEELKRINEKNADLYRSTRIQLDKLRTMYEIAQSDYLYS